MYSHLHPVPPETDDRTDSAGSCCDDPLESLTDETWDGGCACCGYIRLRSRTQGSYTFRLWIRLVDLMYLLVMQIRIRVKKFAMSYARRGQGLLFGYEEG